VKRNVKKGVKKAVKNRVSKREASLGDRRRGLSLPAKENHDILSLPV
jgi:hypothetical protein